MSKRVYFFLGAVTAIGLLIVVLLGGQIVANAPRDLGAPAARSEPLAGGLSALGLQGAPTPAVASLYVVGTGSVSLVPDIARISIGVETTLPTAQAAVAETNQKQNAILDALKAKGVEAKDLRTLDFSVNVDQRSRPDGTVEIRGYRAANTVQVTVRNVTQVGALLDAAVSAGANNIYGISFGIADTEKAQADARDKAIANARVKADAMAKAAGVKLGKVLNISELSSSVPTPRIGIALEARASAPIEVGESQISVQVQITFAIE